VFLESPESLLIRESAAWVFTILCDSYDLHTHAFSKTKQVYRQQDFWFCIFMSFLYVSNPHVCQDTFLNPIYSSIIFPWLTVRKVEVEVTVVSHVFFMLPCFYLKRAALFESSDLEIQTRDATWSSRQSRAWRRDGVPCFWNRFVSLKLLLCQP